LHEYIIMPNHIHGIIQLVGANNDSPENNDNNVPVVANNHSSENNNNDTRAKNFSPLRCYSPSKTIGAIVRGFKIGVTKWMRQNMDVHDVWQRNYYEHIIRNERSFKHIAEYIINNPNMWNKDKFYNG